MLSCSLHLIDILSPPQGGSDESHLTKSGEPDRRFKEHGGGSHGMFNGLLYMRFSLSQASFHSPGNQGTGFTEDGDGTSRMRTQGTGEDGTYKPSAHGGQKEDGGQDKRVRCVLLLPVIRDYCFGSTDVSFLDFDSQLRAWIRR